jgi:hypothetical protein
MDINLQGGIKLPQSLPGARSPDLPVAKPKTSDTQIAASLPGQDKAAPVDTETKRQVAVQTAAKSFFKDVYAVSDTTFSIYKDASGQYITRYTSLRDGKVTYIPEPDMLEYLERRKHVREALVEIQA